MEEKDADNMRKVLCKSFIQLFWELNLCSYKYRVDCFDSLRLFFCSCWSESLARNITKHLMSGPSGNLLVLFSLASWTYCKINVNRAFIFGSHFSHVYDLSAIDVICWKFKMAPRLIKSVYSSFSWLLRLDGFQFNFLLRDSEKDL